MNKSVVGRVYLITIAIVLLALCAAARADYIELADGQVITGTIVEETRDAVRIRTEIHGIATTVTYKRTLIVHYVIDSQDQQPDPQATPHAPSALPQEDQPQPTGPVVAVVPVHGQIGGLVKGKVHGTIDAAMIAESLRAAEEAGAELVILDINSPGGLVSEMEAICQTIIKWHPRLRIVAFTQDAFSAAAIVALSCRELAVRSNSRIGAAVIVRQDDNGWSALDAKLASAHHARQRQFMAASGQPYDIVAAMTIMDTTLWWSDDSGFSTTKPDDAAGGWEEIVGPREILTMTGEEAQRWGVASAVASNPYALAVRLGYSDPNVLSLDDLINTQQRSAQREYDRMLSLFNRYFSGLMQLRDGLQQFIAAANANDREAADRVRSQIHRGHGSVLNVGRTIRRIDRSTLLRRVELPDEVLEQIERDAELLGRIRRLIDSNTIDGVNESVDRFNTVIDGWSLLFNG